MLPGGYSLSIHLPDGFGTYRSFANVTLADKGCAQIDWNLTYKGRVLGQVIDEHSTRSRASYLFEHLSPGDYLVNVRDAGTVTEEGASTTYFPHSTAEDARRVILGASATYDHVGFRLKPLRKTLSVRVRVRQPDGSPAPAGLYLFAFRTTAPDGNLRARA